MVVGCREAPCHLFSFYQAIELSVCAFHVLGKHLGINLRGCNVGMPKHLRHDFDWNAF